MHGPPRDHSETSLSRARDLPETCRCPRFSSHKCSAVCFRAFCAPPRRHGLVQAPIRGFLASRCDVLPAQDLTPVSEGTNARAVSCRRAHVRPRTGPARDRVLDALIAGPRLGLSRVLLETTDRSMLDLLDCAESRQCDLRLMRPMEHDR